MKNDLKLDRKKFNDEKINSIVKRIIKFLDEKEGSWDDENSASRIVDYIFNELSADQLKMLAKAYFNIYCDRIHRRDSFEQKKVANRIFRTINKDNSFVKDVVKPCLRERLHTAIETAYLMDIESREDIKDQAVYDVYNRYGRAFDSIDKNIVEKEFDKAFSKNKK